MKLNYSLFRIVITFILPLLQINFPKLFHFDYLDFFIVYKFGCLFYKNAFCLDPFIYQIIYNIYI